jgi:hypothetical protein
MNESPQSSKDFPPWSIKRSQTVVKRPTAASQELTTWRMIITADIAKLAGTNQEAMRSRL